LEVEGGPDTIVLPRPLRHSRRHRRPDRPLPRDQLLLVVEVLSPSTARADRFAKRRLYQEAGVPRLWIVDPDAACVEVWTRCALPRTCSATA
ncbi:MAG: Uma2 family endonuclease, partial [Gemmatimonadetes bacterium]|nr:Uma2 family endonuclease [Gemmatimonadota bacterium]